MAKHESKAGGEAIWTEVFDGGGQGGYAIEVVVFPQEQYGLKLFTPIEPDRAWFFPMRNAGEEDIAVAVINLKTMLWRMSGWYLQKFIEHINHILKDKIVDTKTGLASVRYGLHVLADNPFEDPEGHTPVAVIDQYSSGVVEYQDSLGPRRYVTEPVQEPWAAVFMHDSTCISLLPEGEDSYFWMLDLLEEVMPFAERLFIDQADYLGLLRQQFTPNIEIHDFDFLQDWGLGQI